MFSLAFLGSQANNRDISGDFTFWVINSIKFHKCSYVGLSSPSSQELNERCGMLTGQESPITLSPEEAALLEMFTNRFPLNEESINRYGRFLPWIRQNWASIHHLPQKKLRGRRSHAGRSK
jgi:hypothetical protein